MTSSPVICYNYAWHGKPCILLAFYIRFIFYLFIRRSITRVHEISHDAGLGPAKMELAAVDLL